MESDNDCMPTHLHAQHPPPVHIPRHGGVLELHPWQYIVPLGGGSGSGFHGVNLRWIGGIEMMC